MYLERKRINDDWFEKAKKIKKINCLSVFIQKTFQTYKDSGKSLPKLQEIVKLSKTLNFSEKNKYKVYAEEIK